MECAVSKYKDVKGLEAFESGKEEKINVCLYSNL
jgi:hypothetical protein